MHTGQAGDDVPWLAVSDIAPRGPSPGMLDINDLMGGGRLRSLRQWFENVVQYETLKELADCERIDRDAARSYRVVRWANQKNSSRPGVKGAPEMFLKRSSYDT